MNTAALSRADPALAAACAQFSEFRNSPPKEAGSFARFIGNAQSCQTAPSKPATSDKPLDGGDRLLPLRGSDLDEDASPAGDSSRPDSLPSMVGPQMPLGAAPMILSLSFVLPPPSGGEEPRSKASVGAGIDVGGESAVGAPLTPPVSFTLAFSAGERQRALAGRASAPGGASDSVPLSNLPSHELGALASSPAFDPVAPQAAEDGDAPSNVKVAGQVQKEQGAFHEPVARIERGFGFLSPQGMSGERAGERDMENVPPLQEPPALLPTGGDLLPSSEWATGSSEVESAESVAGDPVPKESGRYEGKPALKPVLPDSGAPAHGTAIAKLPSTMKNADQMDILAGRAEQFLPPGLLPTSALSEELLPEPRRDFTFPTLVKSAAPASQQEPPAWILSAPAFAPATVPCLEGKTVADVSAPARVEEIIQQQAVRLRSLGAHSMAVVINPDPQTELLLHVRNHHGIVEARAELSQGDFAALNAQWPELQRRLEEQGIRVAPLLREQGFDAAANGGFSQSRSHREPPVEDGLISPPPLSDTSTASVRSRAAERPDAVSSPRADRRWQTWA